MRSTDQRHLRLTGHPGADADREGDSTDAIRTASRRAQRAWLEGDVERGLQATDHQLSASTSAFGRGHEETAYAKTNRARFLMKDGRPLEAVELLSSARGVLYSQQWGRERLMLDGLLLEASADVLISTPADLSSRSLITPKEICFDACVGLRAFSGTIDADIQSQFIRASLRLETSGRHRLAAKLLETLKEVRAERDGDLAHTMIDIDRLLQKGHHEAAGQLLDSVDVAAPLYKDGSVRFTPELYSYRVRLMRGASSNDVTERTAYEILTAPDLATADTTNDRSLETAALSELARLARDEQKPELAISLSERALREMSLDERSDLTRVALRLGIAHTLYGDGQQSAALRELRELGNEFPRLLFPARPTAVSSLYSKLMRKLSNPQRR